LQKAAIFLFCIAATMGKMHFVDGIEKQAFGGAFFPVHHS